MTEPGGAWPEAVEVYHEAGGPVHAPVVVLSHAIGTSMEMWEPQRAALERRFRVVRYDHRGHGGSPIPKGPYSIDQLGADVIALADRLGVERFSVCGLSLGAMTALWLGAHAPDRIERIVAMAVIARPRSPEAWADRAAAVRSGGTASIAELVLTRWGYADRRPDLARQVIAMLAATPARGYAGACGAIEHLDLEPDLPAVRAATLVLAGSVDPSAPPTEARQIAGRVQHGRWDLVADAAHLMNVEQPEAVTRLVIDHLASAEPGGSA